MQWVLQCIAAMRGSVEPRDDSCDGDDSLPGDFDFPTMAFSDEDMPISTIPTSSQQPMKSPTLRAEEQQELVPDMVF
jgi:hypothetical protein